MQVHKTAMLHETNPYSHPADPGTEEVIEGGVLGQLDRVRLASLVIHIQPIGLVLVQGTIFHIVIGPVVIIRLSHLVGRIVVGI